VRQEAGHRIRVAGPFSQLSTFALRVPRQPERLRSIGHAEGCFRSLSYKARSFALHKTDKTRVGAQCELPFLLSSLAECTRLPCFAGVRRAAAGPAAPQIALTRKTKWGHPVAKGVPPFYPCCCLRRADTA